jgi:hypothetical protein
MKVNIQFSILLTTCEIFVNRKGEKVVEIVIPSREPYFVDKKSVAEAEGIRLCENWDEVIRVIDSLNRDRREESISPEY